MLHVCFDPILSATIVCSQLIVCSDTVGKRTLTGSTFASGSLTNTQCVQFCASKGNYYAGTEYSQECFCANFLQNGGAAAADADCNMACAGRFDASAPQLLIGLTARQEMQQRPVEVQVDCHYSTRQFLRAPLGPLSIQAYMVFAVSAATGNCAKFLIPGPRFR